MELMDKITGQLTDIRRTLTLSVVLHIIVALLLTLSQVTLEFDRPEFTEIDFLSGEEPTNTAPAPAEEAPQPVPQEQQVEEPPEPAAQQTEANAVPVELPRRRMLEETEPDLTPQEMDKLAQTRSPEQDRIPPQRTETGQPAQRATTRSAGEKLSAGPQQLPVAQRGVVPSTESGGPSRAQPFTIEGEAANREIVHKVIPDYPDDLQQEAVIRIRFTVLPDGRVGQMIPVQKDYPTLEDLTLEALEQWRFNPLPPGVKQQPVQGIITFRYELE